MSELFRAPITDFNNVSLVQRKEVYKLNEKDDISISESKKAETSNRMCFRVPPQSAAAVTQDMYMPPYGLQLL